MLKINNLFYRYQNRKEQTLQGINLQLAAGELLLLAGKSGCGKSTLIKAISGLLGDEEQGDLIGQIVFDGEDISRAEPEKIGLLVGTVYQSPDDQLFAMTVFDEVAFALENRGVEPKEIQATVREILDLVGLAELEKNSIHQLSGGQRQRLALASILVTKPKLLVLDEPVSQMNPKGVQEFMQLLLKLNREAGVAVLMIEHRVNELFQYFSRLAIMREGKIVYDGMMEKAWDFLAELDKEEKSGLRVPQSIKLCQSLGLKNLTTDNNYLVQQIKAQKQLCYAEVTAHSDNAPTILLELQNVSYTYPGTDTPVIYKLDLQLYTNQITALMGFNGAGKSTLLNMLGGLTHATAGKILLQGQDISKELGLVGYLRQEPDLMLLADTVREELLWKNKLLDERGVDSLLEKLHLSKYKYDFPLALSKGQRLRTVLGAMLAKQPPLLLLDEPTTGQDEESLKEIKRLLLEYKAQGGSCFICTHDIELASEVADRVVVLKEGAIFADGSSRDILSQRNLLEEGGLAVPPMLKVSELLGVQPCITIEEVAHYVR